MNHNISIRILVISVRFKCLLHHKYLFSIYKDAVCFFISFHNI